MIRPILVILLVGLGLNSAISFSPVVEGPGLFAFVDRMVYGRPSEVIIFGIVLDEGGRPERDVAISVDVLNPEGEIVFSDEVATGDDGKFMTKFRVSANSLEGEYTVLVVDLGGLYGDVTLFFEVCSVCSLPFSAVTTTVFRTTTEVSTTTRIVTMLDTISEGQIITVTFTSVVNGSVITQEFTKTVTAANGFWSSYLFYVGLGMVVVLGVASAIVARRLRQEP